MQNQADILLEKIEIDKQNQINLLQMNFQQNGTIYYQILQVMLSPYLLLKESR